LTTRKVKLFGAVFILFLGMWSILLKFFCANKLMLLLSCSLWKCQNIFVAGNIATDDQSSELVDVHMVSQHKNDTIATNLVKTERFSSFATVDDILVAHLWDFSGDPSPSATFMATLIDSNFELITELIFGSIQQRLAFSMVNKG
jgi:hypothetical protein